MSENIQICLSGPSYLTQNYYSQLHPFTRKFLNFVFLKQLNNSPLYKSTRFSLSIHQLMNTKLFPFPGYCEQNSKEHS